MKNRIIVIGGGIIGNSVAYHLGRRGCKEVLLLEQHKVTSGTTWHAAGLMVTFGSMSETSTALRKYTKDLYDRLEKETGQATGFRKCGFISVATNQDYLQEFRRVAAFNRVHGIDVEEIGPSRVKELFPLCETKDILAGFYVKDDGRVNPVDAAMALQKGAKMHGVEYREGVRCEKVVVRGNHVVGVETEDREILEADCVVNCAGMWARQLGERNGIKSIPNQAAEHYYLVTDRVDELDQSWPIVEDPSSFTYIRPETNGGLMIGLFEGQGAAWNVDRIPDHFAFGEIEPDWDRLAPYLEKAMDRVPVSKNVGAKKFFCGPESFTPDGSPVVGECPEVRNYFVAAGLNSIGILSGGGIGRLLANWIVDGKPDMDVTELNVTRFEPYQSTPMFRNLRVQETLANVYKCHYPYKQPSTARNLKLSPLHERLKAKGAKFKCVSGWEGADYFSDKGKEEEQESAYLTWERGAYFEDWAKEHRACREDVVLIDMSFMAKFLVQGKEAGKMLNYLSTANVNRNKECITYTQWLNDDGMIEADLTVAKLEENKFLVVATDTMNGQVEHLMRQYLDNVPLHAFVTNVTGQFAQINLQGPRSRELLQSMTSADLSNESFPFRTFREIDIGCCRVFCGRITYVGELGYELYIPCEQAVHVYDEIMGRKPDLVHAGLKALGSLRMEKAYRDYGHDIDNTDHPYSVGLGFTCDFKTKDEFRGKDAVLKIKNQQQKHDQKLMQVLVNDPTAMLYHGEVILLNGKPVGTIRSASYGHTLGGAVGLAMISYKNADPATAKWEVDIGGHVYPIQLTIPGRPFQDPKGEKILS